MNCWMNHITLTALTVATFCTARLGLPSAHAQQGAVPAQAEPPEYSAKLASKEVPLGLLPALSELTNLVCNADNTKAACPVRRGGKWTVWNAGKESAPYERVGSLTFSPDGRRFAFAAQKGPQDFALVVDGEETAAASLVGRIKFSPDSRRMAYFDVRIPPGASRAKIFVVLDGEKGPEFDVLITDQFVFSPDSKRFACAIGRFAPDSAGRSAQPHRGCTSVVVDGIEGNAYDKTGLNTLMFSPDSRHVAFAAVRAGKWMVVLDGKEEKAYEEIGTPSLCFSPDGNRLAYLAKENGRWMAVVNGQEGKPYEGFQQAPVFSPDGRRLGYCGERGRRIFAVVDGVESAGFDQIGPDGIVFSPDSQHVAYLAKRDGKARLMLDNRAVGAPFDGFPGAPLFSPDSLRVAWVASRGGKVRVVEANQEGNEYEHILFGSVAFSPDSKHLAYVAARNGKPRVVVDGVESAAYEGLVPKLVFADSDHVSAIGVRFDDAFRDQLVRIEMKIAPTSRR